MTRPSKPTPPVQLEPASICPAKVTSCPWHGPPPSTTPAARNLSANGAGIWVRPGSTEIRPVGLSGVPPQVHLKAARAGVAPAASVRTVAMAHALAPIIVRACTSLLLRRHLVADKVSKDLRKCQLALAAILRMVCKQQSRR